MYAQSIVYAVLRTHVWLSTEEQGRLVGPGSSYVANRVASSADAHQWDVEGLKEGDASCVALH